jgi:hypothetical protein
MSAELTFGDLHDASVRSIRIDWCSGTVLVEVVVVGGRAASILVTGLRRLDCPREQPWGTDPHGTIYDARVRQEAASMATLELEMQTGDVVKVTGEAVSLGRPSRSPDAP